MRSFSRVLALVLAGFVLFAGSVRASRAAQITASADAPASLPPPTPPAISSALSGDTASVVDLMVNTDRVRVIRNGKESYTIELDDLGDIPNLKAILDSGGIVVGEDGDTVRVSGTGRRRSIGHGVIQVDSDGSDRVQVGGSVEVEEGEVVDGDAVAVGGNVTIAGEVGGDAVAVGGSIYLKSTAVVKGEVVCIGGTIKRDEGSKVSGQIVNVGPGVFPFLSPIIASGVGSGISKVVSLGLKLVQLLVMVLVIFLVLALWGGRVRAMATVLPTRPWHLGLVGILGWFLVIPGCLLLLISCIGAIFIPVFLALFLFSLFVGLITFYIVVGECLGGASGAEKPLVGTAIRGLFAVHACSIVGGLLGIASEFLGPFPVILSVFGKVIVFLAATVGLGAVLYTRFGKRNVPGAATVEDRWGGASGGGAGTGAGFGAGSSANAGAPVEPPPFPPAPEV